jgi:hypothetical protein
MVEASTIDEGNSYIDGGNCGYRFWDVCHRRRTPTGAPLPPASRGWGHGSRGWGQTFVFCCLPKSLILLRIPSPNHSGQSCGLPAHPPSPLEQLGGPDRGSMKTLRPLPAVGVRPSFFSCLPKSLILLPIPSPLSAYCSRPAACRPTILRASSNSGVPRSAFAQVSRKRRLGVAAEGGVGLATERLHGRFRLDVAGASRSLPLHQVLPVFRAPRIGAGDFVEDPRVLVEQTHEEVLLGF